MNGRDEKTALGIANSKGILLQEALNIVDELAKSPIADSDGEDGIDVIEIAKIKILIVMARTLKNDYWYKQLSK